MCAGVVEWGTEAEVGPGERGKRQKLAISRLQICDYFVADEVGLEQRSRIQGMLGLEPDGAVQIKSIAFYLS